MEIFYIRIYGKLKKVARDHFVALRLFIKNIKKYE